jgi:hypothetical protein
MRYLLLIVFIILGPVKAGYAVQGAYWNAQQFIPAERFSALLNSAELSFSGVRGGTRKIPHQDISTG